MCIELTLTDGCEKVMVMKSAIVMWEKGADHDKGSEVTLVTEQILCVEECPTTIHKLVHAE